MGVEPVDDGVKDLPRGTAPSLSFKKSMSSLFSKHGISSCLSTRVTQRKTPSARSMTSCTRDFHSSPHRSILFTLAPSSPSTTFAMSGLVCWCNSRNLSRFLLTTKASSNWFQGRLEAQTFARPVLARETRNFGRSWLPRYSSSPSIKIQKHVVTF